MVTMLNCGNEEPEDTCTLPKVVNSIPRLVQSEPDVRMAGAGCTFEEPHHNSVAQA